uniref:WW domain-binding protein 4 n=1 Tax=Bombyx mori TaxID=7091 RepID=A0A8R2DK48_BOMMO|nr:WW domain binding protein 4 isoform X2 [Bombyx mori]
MTEYWKSQARKYCEFCKCWFADNKVSTSFHENGKKHKDKVQEHISKLSKKSAKDFKQKEKMDDEIKKMEAAAMTAYIKDVQNNADLTSQNINQMLGGDGSNKSNPKIVASEIGTKSEPIWHEVKNQDGSSYYWNTITSETTWEQPDEYFSIVEQEKKKHKEEQAEIKKQNLKKEKHKEAIKEVKAHMAREKMKERAVKKDESVLTKSAVDYGPAPRASKPYGTWTEIVKEPAKTVDLQLPKTKELPPPPVVVEPEKFQFKEKRVETLGEGPVEFKKRKLNNPKRNMRQKVDDE